METAITVNKPTPVDLYSSPTLQELSTKRSFDQAELPTPCETVDQKHDSDNHRCSELLTKLQNEDSVSIQITGSRTRSENSIQIIEYYLLIEVGLKENRRRDILLEDIADASAQFIPIHNQANRYKVVVKLIDDCIPFFSIGPTRIRADIDILNEAKVYVTGTLAHDEKLRGSIAVERQTTFQERGGQNGSRTARTRTRPSHCRIAFSWNASIIERRPAHAKCPVH